MLRWYWQLVWLECVGIGNWCGCSSRGFDSWDRRNFGFYFFIGETLFFFFFNTSSFIFYLQTGRNDPVKTHATRKLKKPSFNSFYHRKLSSNT